MLASRNLLACFFVLLSCSHNLNNSLITTGECIDCRSWLFVDGGRLYDRDAGDKGLCCAYDMFVGCHWLKDAIMEDGACEPQLCCPLVCCTSVYIQMDVGLSYTTDEVEILYVNCNSISSVGVPLSNQPHHSYNFVVTPS